MSFVLPQSKHQANRPNLHMGASYRQNLVASAPQSTHPTVSIFPARDMKPLLAVGCLSGIQREEKEDAEYRLMLGSGTPTGSLFPAGACPAQGATIQSPSAHGKKDHGVEEAGLHPRGATA